MMMPLGPIRIAAGFLCTLYLRAMAFSLSRQRGAFKVLISFSILVVMAITTSLSSLKVFCACSRAFRSFLQSRHSCGKKLKITGWPYHSLSGEKVALSNGKFWEFFICSHLKLLASSPKRAPGNFLFSSFSPVYKNTVKAAQILSTRVRRMIWCLLVFNLPRFGLGPGRF